MRYPSDLQPGGTIGFLAPSFGCAMEPYYSQFQNSLKNWKKQGYQVKLGPNCLAQEGVGISNTPEKCGAEIMESFEDPESDVLIACGGGELMCEDLDHVDFGRLAKLPPKWYMGYSDNTNLTFLLPTLCDTASIYGPCAGAFGTEPRHESLEDACGVLTGKKRVMSAYELWESESLKNEENPLVSYNVTEPRVHKLYVDGRFIPDARETDIACTMEGRLLGGCMDCLANLVGTPYDRVAAFSEKYKEDGILWFLEACDLNVFAIRRAMWQLEHAGWFQYVKGFLFGRPANGQQLGNLDAYQAVLNVASGYQVPVVMDMDIGHRPPMMPLVTGCVARVSVQGNALSMEMQYK